MHHPFTMPKDRSGQNGIGDLKSVRADCYDFILNGTEIASGSIRINLDIQKKF